MKHKTCSLQRASAKGGPTIRVDGVFHDRRVTGMKRELRLRNGRSALLFALAISCGSPGADADVGARVPKVHAADSQAPPPRPAALPPRDSVSAHAPTWDLDLAVGALRSAGIRAVVAGPVREPFFGVQGTLVNIPGAELELFVYGDAIAAGRDIDGLDTLTVSPHGRRVVWRKPPALVTSNNLVTIVLTANPAMREQVRRVLGTITDGRHTTRSP